MLLDLKNIFLGEMQPKKIFKKWGLKRVKLYSSVQNVAVLNLTELITVLSAKGIIFKEKRLLLVYSGSPKKSSLMREGHPSPY